jgi:type VI secretion system protein ImpL
VALVNSGLQFPLAEKLGTREIRGVGGTRNCDWFFTDEAVLIDTAGRWTTQESDREVDSTAWQGFLQLLKKFRPRRPVNGVILAVSVPDLLQQTPQEREKHAAEVRARLQELYDQFQNRFPIYVLVTKADLLAGFSEFYGEFGKEERAQVWGITFPYSPDTKLPPLAEFDAEYELLEKRVLDRVLDRLQAERDPGKRALIFAFPQQFSSVKPLLANFLEHVFISSKFEETPMLRGVYFTSGTQEGSPIDRVIGQLARAFGVERNLLPAQRSSGRSYFITQLLYNVVFPEQGLAGSNLRWERRRTFIQVAAYVGISLMVILACAAWLTSYVRNQTYVREVEARVAPIRKQVEALPTTGTTDVVSLVPLLDALRGLGTTPEVADGGVPLTMGFGLFQGDKLAAASDQAYRQLLQDALMPRIALRIEEQLRGVNPSNLEVTYEALKVYLMLHDPSHFDAAALKTWITFDWERQLPRDFTQEQRRALEGHLDTLLERGAVTSPVPADEKLIQSVRTMLARYPPRQQSV